MRTRTPQFDRIEAPEKGVGEGPSGGVGGGAGTERTLDVLTIDGPAGAGKSSVAGAVAERLGFRFLNTGLFYRGVTWRVLRDGLEQDPSRWTEGLDVEVEDDAVVVIHDNQSTRIGVDELRRETTSPLLSELSMDPRVREFLLPAQRRFAAGKSLVVEGRDTGSVVFPNARWKAFLVASLDVRAERRLKQDEAVAAASGDRSSLRSLDEIRCEIACRDSIDFCREHAPLRRPDDAFYIDTSDLSEAEVVERVAAWVEGGAS